MDNGDRHYYEARGSAEIPPHHRDVDKNPDNIPLSKEILIVIDRLIEDHKFAKNYGPKRLVTDLRHQGVAESKNSHPQAVTESFILLSSNQVQIFQ